VDNKPGQREKDIFASYEGELKDFESPTIMGLNTSKSNGMPQSQEEYLG
jgi:hypothetical protein